MKQPEVFISYSWSSESMKIAGEVEAFFEKKGIPIIRDKKEVGYKGLIKEFMQRIGKGKYIILIVSDHYLKSENCMFELMQVAKSGEFYDRIFPLVLESAEIYKAYDRLDYVHYWKDEIEKLEEKMKKGGLTHLQGIYEDLNLYSEIRQNIAGLTDILKNINSLSIKMHQDSNYEELYNAIMENFQKKGRLSASEIDHFEERKKYKYYADRIDQSKKFQHHFYNSDNKVQVYFIHGKKNQSPSGLYKRICLERSRFNKDDIFCLTEPIKLESLKYKEYCKTDLLVKLFEKFGFDLGYIDKDKRNIRGLSELPPLKIKKYVFIGVTIGYDEWEQCVPELLGDFFKTILSEKMLPREAPTFIFIFLLNYPGKKSLKKFSSEREELFELNTCSTWLPRLDPVLKADIKNWFEKYMPDCKKEKQYIDNYFKGNRFKMVDVEKHLEKVIKDIRRMDKMITLDMKLSETPQISYQPDPTKYLLTEELKSAVKVAITLGQPLLITGEPGTGKTQLAYKVAYDLSRDNPEFYETPFVFNTKTTSTATDLFYLYDAIRHFHDANIRKTTGEEIPHISNYIKLQALGKAIALSNEKEIERKEFIQTSAAGPKSSVVLIDEIDKAPRDFPNDILDEIEKFQFEIKEAENYKITKGESQRIIVIMTSNSEKNLPDAFLRRCVFYHIPFPGKEELFKIVQSHLGEDSEYAKDDELIKHFQKIREILTKKKPATAELIAWLRILELKNFILDGKVDFDNLTTKQKKILMISYLVLAKTKEDLETLGENV
jgi:MoxR-like ATPase